MTDINDILMSGKYDIPRQQDTTDVRRRSLEKMREIQRTFKAHIDLFPVILTSEESIDSIRIALIETCIVARSVSYYVMLGQLLNLSVKLANKFGKRVYLPIIEEVTEYIDKRGNEIIYLIYDSLYPRNIDYTIIDEVFLSSSNTGFKSKSSGYNLALDFITIVIFRRLGFNNVDMIVNGIKEVYRELFDDKAKSSGSKLTYGHFLKYEPNKGSAALTSLITLIEQGLTMWYGPLEIPLSGSTEVPKKESSTRSCSSNAYGY